MFNPLLEADKFDDKVLASPRGTVNRRVDDHSDMKLHGFDFTALNPSTDDHAAHSSDPLDIDALLSGTTNTMRPADPASDGRQGGTTNLASPRTGGRPNGNTAKNQKRKRQQGYSKVGDVCCDEVSQHHFVCFPCAVDGMYRAMSDDGFTPCSVFAQMLLLAYPCFLPGYWLCCCTQSFVIRHKFNVIVDIKEERLETICSAVFCPWVISAQIHREIELRGQPVYSACCGSDNRIFSSDLHAPAIPDMDQTAPSLPGYTPDGRKVPFLMSSTGAKGSESSFVLLPVVTECCGRKVVYNSWRHFCLLGCHLATDMLFGLLEFLFTCCGGA